MIFFFVSVFRDTDTNLLCTQEHTRERLRRIRPRLGRAALLYLRHFHPVLHPAHRDNSVLQQHRHDHDENFRRHGSQRRRSAADGAAQAHNSRYLRRRDILHADVATLSRGTHVDGL